MLLSVNHDVSRVAPTGARICQVVARVSVVRVRAAHVVTRVLGATGVRMVHVVAWVGVIRAAVAQVVAWVAVTGVRSLIAHDVSRVAPTVVVAVVTAPYPGTRL